MQAEVSELNAERLAWVKNMRRQFSPKEMLTDDGEINQEYFKPTQVFLEQNELPFLGRKWIYKMPILNPGIDWTP